MQDVGLHYLQAFFMSAYIVLPRYWYPCTPVYRLNGHTASGEFVLSNGSGTDTFFIVMMNNLSSSNAAMLSGSGTSAYETGIPVIAMSNPYEYFRSLGISLQGLSVRFLPKPRKNGVAVTGVFNFDGIYFTVGAKDFSALLADALRQYREKQAYHKACQAQKRERYCQNWIERHPDATVLPVFLLQ